MKRIIYFLSILFLALTLLSSCNFKAKKKIISQDFPYVSPPTMMTQTKEISNWVALHYWDKYLDTSRVFPIDTNLICGITKLSFEKAYRDYIINIFNSDLKVALQGQKKLCLLTDLMMDKYPDSPLFEDISGISTEFLFGVNSNYRNEELYIPMLEFFINSKFVDENQKKLYEKDLKECLKNRIGQPASDFEYSTRNGKISSLYKIKADYTIIIFSNPGCNACKDVMKYVDSSDKITKLIIHKRIAILNMFIDENIADWYKESQLLPKELINAYDPNLIIRNKGLYYVRAIPSIYILDKDKKTLYKDVPTLGVINFLKNMPLIENEKN